MFEQKYPSLVSKSVIMATAEHLFWSEAKLDVSNLVSRALEFLRQAKMQIHAKVKEETSITLEKPDLTGHGGTWTTGNIAKVMLKTPVIGHC